MAINPSAQDNGGFLQYIILLALSYKHWGTLTV